MTLMDATQRIELASWQLMKHLRIDLNSAGMSQYLSETLDIPLADVKKRVGELQRYNAQLKVLNAQPKVQQRTEEWYAMRRELLTASDTAQALGKSKYGKPQQLVQKKAFPDKFPMFNSMSVAPLRHGVIYEDMAVRCYTQRRADIAVHDFGLIPHPTLKCYGASPDGITELGIMLEIKCPYARVINGCIPEHYYLQMQGQMAVCGLNECDYIECDIMETQNVDIYNASVTDASDVDHGIVLESSETNGHVYSPPRMTRSAVLTWLSEQSIEGKKVCYWVLRKIEVQRVLFDEDKWREYEPLITKFWEDVKAARGSVPPEQTPVKKYEFLVDSDDDV